MLIITEAQTERLPERVKRELVRGANARAEFAIAAQNRLQEAIREDAPVRHIEGLGVKRASICRDLVAHLRTKFGVSCLHDPHFLNSLLRDNPFLRVDCTPRALTLRVPGLREQPISRRSEVGTREAAAMSAQPARVAGVTGDPAPRPAVGLLGPTSQTAGVRH